MTVHPRVCGEHLLRITHTVQRAGSSPRVRGTRLVGVERAIVLRFIPACAGNTGHAGRAAKNSPVHPRVCGEHAHSRAGRGGLNGSSPRVRGTPARTGIDEKTIRFIPACAGNTAFATSAGNRPAVHPRVCGEHGKTEREKWPGAGSSPRVRGTPPNSTSAPLPPRFIPACAGNTRPASFLCWAAPVHPRVCGEHQTAQVQHLTSTGSSPRVRGTPGTGASSIVQFRFIPACAGNTTQSSHPRRR